MLIATRAPSSVGLLHASKQLSGFAFPLMLEMLVAAHDAGRLQFFGDHAHLADKAAFKAYLAPLHRTKWFVYSKRTGASLSWVPMSEVGPNRARRWYEGLRERRASSVKHSVNPAGMVGPVQSSE